MSSTMISSAVVIPDQQPIEEPPHSPSPSLKRRPSSLSLESTNSTNKRPRLASTTDPDNRSPVLPQAISPPAPHRKPPQNTTEEKRRNRRLFGTLLTTLSQTTPKPNKKRDEIEKRQIERVRRDQEEREEERRRKKRELEVQRGEGWRVWEEESRRVVWRNRRAVAGFLRTEVEPRLYWRPWELREGERERVKGQKGAVEEEIRREAEELGLKREGKVEGGVEEGDERKDDGVVNGKAEIDEDDKKEEPSDGQNGDGENKTVEDAVADAPGQADEETRTPPVQEKPKEEDHGGEELVEGHEDDVIY